MDIKRTELIIDSIKFDSYIGHYESEQIAPQTLQLYLRFIFSATPNACITDKLEETVDYEKITNLVIDKTKGQRFKLIEHMAHYIYGEIKSEIGKIAQLELKLTKTKFPGLDLTHGATFIVSEI